MRTASAIYKMLKASKTSWYEIRVLCGSNIYGSDKLKSVRVHYSLGSESGISIGNANSAECKLTVIEQSANWARMAEFTVQFRLRNQTGTINSVWVTVGTFYTDERHEDKYGNLTIVGFDAMLKTEKYWTETVPEELLPDSYPITARAFAQMVQSAGICSFENLSVLDDTSAFIGFDTESTVRDKLKDIASAHGGNWMYAPYGKLRLVKYENFEIESTLAGIAIAGIAVVGKQSQVSGGSAQDYTLLNLSVKTFDKSPELPQISGVTLETESGVAISTGDDTTFMLKGLCNFSSTDCGIETICLSNLLGYAYKPFDITGAYLDPVTEIGDFVLVEGIGYQIMDIDWNFTKMPTASLSAPYDEEVDHEYTVVDPRTKSYRKSMKAIENAKDELNTEITQTAEAIMFEATRTYETKSDASDKLDAAEEYADAQIQIAADSITSIVALSQKQYDTSEYSVDYYGYGAPSTAKYPPEDNDGKYYLDQSNGYLYVCDGSNWSVTEQLNLITSTQQTAIQQNATDISAKVSKTGGTNGSNSFSWSLTDSGHNWYANGAQDPVVSITGSGLSVKGEVKATSGYIGNENNGFSIGARSISNGMTSLSDTTHNGVYVGTDGIALGAGTFKVTSTGSVTASNLELKGGSIKLGGTESNPVFSVSSAGAVTASNITINGGSIAIRDSNGNVIFSANSSGVYVNGNGTFTGTVYAGNVVSEATTQGAGYFNGAGLATGTVSGGLSYSGTPTGSLSVGVCQSLGYADLFNSATEDETSTYPAHFTAGYISAMQSFYSDDYYVNTGDDESEYNLAGHYHRITENSDGTVTIGAPYNDTRAPSFNIADTQTYQNGVAAVTIASGSVLATDGTSIRDYSSGFAFDLSNSLYSPPSDTSISFGRIDILNADGTSLKKIRVQVPNNSSTVTIDSVTGDSSSKTYDSNYNVYTIPLSATASNGATGTGTVSVSASEAYTAGSGSVTATVAMTGAQIPAAADNATISATATLSNSTTASGSYAIYLETVTNSSSAVTMQVAHGSGSSKVVLATKTVTPVHEKETATVSITGAQISGAADNAIITATATLSGGNTASDTYSIYMETVTNSTSSVTMQVAHGSGSSKVILAQKTVTPTHPDVTVQTATIIAATSTNYTTYDKSVAPSSAYLYTTGGYSYGLANIALSNGNTSILRFRVPATGGSVSSITVTREYDPRNYSSISDCMQDWDYYGSNLYINTKIEAFSGTSSLGIFDGSVCVTDVVKAFAAASSIILATQTSSENNNYNFEVDTTGYTNAFFKAGNYQYVRFRLLSVYGDELDIVRVKMASMDNAITEVLALVSDSSTYQTYNMQASFLASSVYTPPNSSTQYARVQVNLSSGTNQVIRVALPASSGSASVSRGTYPVGTYYNEYGYAIYYYKWTGSAGYVAVNLTQNGSTTTHDIDVTSLVQACMAIGASGGSANPRTVTRAYYERDEDGAIIKGKISVRFSDGNSQGNISIS